MTVQEWTERSRFCSVSVLPLSDPGKGHVFQTMLLLQLSLFLSPLRLQLGVAGLDNKAPCVRHPVDPGRRANLHPW